IWSSDAAKSVFGFGIGSFGVQYTGYDERFYPHNIVVELMLELGLVGLVLFLLPYVVVTLSWRTIIREPAGWGVIALLAYELCNLMKSFTYADARMLYFSLGLGIIVLSTGRRIRAGQPGDRIAKAV